MKSDLVQKFVEYIKTANLFGQKDRLLVAVSGGVDSVVLCELCKRAGYTFAIAHCNFRLRGEESDEDEIFVKDLAASYGAEFFVTRFDTGKYAAENKLSIQVAARELRYGWFKQLMQQPGGNPFHCLLTAHHANDNIETLLMNFFKGTGISGLQGIRPLRNNGFQLARPLLEFKKEELLQFAELHGLAFREDSSNNTDKYTRNYIRNKLIPALQETFPQLEDNMLNNIRRFRDVHLLYRQSIDVLKKKLIVAKGNEVHIPVNKLLRTSALQTILYEIIKDYGFESSQVDEVIKLLHSGSGKYTLSGTHRILNNRNWLILSPLSGPSSAHFLIEEPDAEIKFSGFTLQLKKSDRPDHPETTSSVAQLDAGEISFPLLLRKWKQGDYFYPLGMKKKKKLSRFFIDQKLSLPEKENSWVIEMNKKIIWVVGRRIDDRFKITGNTKEVVRFSVSKLPD